MSYSKNGNIPCKPTNKIRQIREALLYCQQSRHHSLINILTKYSVVTNWILVQSKSHIKQKSIVLSVVFSQPVTSIVYHGSFGMSFCSSMSLYKNHQQPILPTLQL